MYNTEATFKLIDQASGPLKHLIGEMQILNVWLLSTKKQLSQTNLALASMARNVGLVGKEMKSNLPVMGAIASITSRVGTASAKSAGGITAMGAASKLAASEFATMNSQLNHLYVNAQQATTAMRGLGRASMAASAPQMSLVAGGRGGGGNKQRGMFGAMGAMVGGFTGKVQGAMIGEMTAKAAFDMGKEFMQPSMEYQQQIGGLTAFGMSPQQIKQAEMLARQTSRNVRGSSYTENLKTVKELYGMTKDWNTALVATPIAARFKIAMESVHNKTPSMTGSTDSYVQSSFKALEMQSLRSVPEIEFGLDSLLKQYSISGALVNPNQVAQSIKMQRTGRYGKDEDWAAIMTHFTEESNIAGGKGTSGSSMAALFRTLGAGIMKKSFIAEMASMDMFERPAGVKPGSLPKMVPTTTPGTNVTSRIKNYDQFIANPAKWIWQNLEPAILKKEMPGKSPQEALNAFDKMSSNDPKKVSMLMAHLGGMQQNAQDMVVQMIMMRPALEKEIELLHAAKGVTDQYNYALTTTAIKGEMLEKGFDNLKTTIGLGLMPAINMALDGATNFTFGLLDIQHTMPLVTQAFSDVNDQLFGTSGSFKLLGDSMAKIDWGPMLHVIDALAALTVKTAGADANWVGSIAAGAAQGAKEAGSNPIMRGIGAFFGAVKGGELGLGGLAGSNAKAAGDFISQLAPGSVNAPSMISGLPRGRARASNLSSMLDGLPRGAPYAQAPFGMPPINVTFNGPVSHVEHVREAVRKGIEDSYKTIAMKSYVHAGTTSKAGGHLALGQPLGANQ